jgi:hypothetical protein
MAAHLTTMFGSRVCGHCKGSGEEPPPWLWVLLTFGLYADLAENTPRRCHKCDGAGVVAAPRRRAF